MSDHLREHGDLSLQELDSTEAGDAFVLHDGEAEKLGFGPSEPIEGPCVVLIDRRAPTASAPPYRAAPRRLRQPLIARGDLASVRALAEAVELRARLVAFVAITLASAVPVVTLFWGG